MMHTVRYQTKSCLKLKYSGVEGGINRTAPETDPHQTARLSPAIPSRFGQCAASRGVLLPSSGMLTSPIPSMSTNAMPAASCCIVRWYRPACTVLSDV